MSQSNNPVALIAQARTIRALRLQQQRLENIKQEFQEVGAIRARVDGLTEVLQHLPSQFEDIRAVLATACQQIKLGMQTSATLRATCDTLAVAQQGHDEMLTRQADDIAKAGRELISTFEQLNRIDAEQNAFLEILRQRLTELEASQRTHHDTLLNLSKLFDQADGALQELKKSHEALRKRIFKLEQWRTDIEDWRKAVDARVHEVRGPIFFGGGGGIGEARVLQLIEEFMPTEAVEYPRIEVDIFPVDGIGPHLIYSPASGKALRIRRYRVMSDPDVEDTPSMTLRVGAKFIQSGPVLYGSDFIEGAVDDGIYIDLESASRVTGAIYYEEFTP